MNAASAVMEPRLKAFDFLALNSVEGRLRILSALLLAPVTLAVVYIGGAAYAVVLAMALATGLYEWLRLVDAQAPLPDRLGLYAALVVVLLLAAAGLSSLGVFALAMAATALYVQRGTSDLARAFWFAMGLPYMAGSGMALIYLRATPAVGFYSVVYLLAVVWGMDIGAYFAGRAFGGLKLAPLISPNKTWSGFLGGALLAMVSGAMVLVLTGAHSLGSGLLIAFLLAIAAQVGDLFKSFFKRRAGVKDCGDLIPGHGGILDRIDGLAFAAMLLAFLQAVFGAGMIW
jgi:phosphatidate cytidylyltransferase